MFGKVLMEKYAFMLMVCVLAQSTASFGLPSASPVCRRDFAAFLYDLKSQCPFEDPSVSSPVQVDGESFEKAVSSIKKNEYTAVLFYASWCPFSSTFMLKFSALSSMYPQIKHLMVEKSSAMPSVFSRYGIHSIPSLLIVSKTTRVRYHGQKDLQPLINFYKRTTGLYPVMNTIEETSSAPGSSLKDLQLSHGASLLKEAYRRDPYLLFSVVFVLLRGFFYFFPEIASQVVALWVANIPRLNLAIFGESRLVLSHVLHLINVKRIWNKLKMCKTRNFHRGAKNARAWASSLSSVSLGKTSPSRGMSLRG